MSYTIMTKTLFEEKQNTRFFKMSIESLLYCLFKKDILIKGHSNQFFILGSTII